MASSFFFTVHAEEPIRVLRLQSPDGTNRLTSACVLALTEAVGKLAGDARSLVITGNQKFFSAGADLAEIASLSGPAAYEFSKMGQGPDEADRTISCSGVRRHLRLLHGRRARSRAGLSPPYRFTARCFWTSWRSSWINHWLGRYAASATTDWEDAGLQMFVAAEKLDATEALQVGLVDAVADDPVAEAVRRITFSPSEREMPAPV